MNITEPQLSELRRLGLKPQHTFGSSTARLQRALVQKGLARFIYKEDGFPKTPEFADRCEITEAGRALLQRVGP